MAYDSDLPDLPADLAALSHEELADLFAAAYAERNRTEFLRLGQRLVREVVLGLRGARLASHRAELYSEGALALVQRFDKVTRPIEHPYWYFRTAVRRAILGWACQQKIIRRKGAKHRDVLLDVDVFADDDFATTFVESAAVAPDDDDSPCAIHQSAADPTDTAILLGLQNGLPRARIAAENGLDTRTVNQRINAMRARLEDSDQRTAGVKLAASIARALCVPIDDVIDVRRQTYTPAQLRALGYSYPAIAERLGMKYLDVFWACNPGKRTGYGQNPNRKTRRNAMAS